MYLYIRPNSIQDIILYYLYTLIFINSWLPNQINLNTFCEMKGWGWYMEGWGGYMVYTWLLPLPNMMDRVRISVGPLWMMSNSIFTNTSHAYPRVEGWNGKNIILFFQIEEFETRFLSLAFLLSFPNAKKGKYLLHFLIIYPNCFS